MTDRPGSVTRTTVDVVADGRIDARPDRVATEEPLQIRLVAGGRRLDLAVTMRTPGADFELAAGFLYSEGIVQARDEVGRIGYCVDRDVDADQRFNIVNVALAPGRFPAGPALERHFQVTSACGVCGRAHLEALEIRSAPIAGGVRVDARVLHRLPSALRSAQGIFESTGGLHAAGAFDRAGDLIALREDVGRHNAVDKVVGWALLSDRLPLDECILMVSGRAGYEILQKAVVARIPIVCSVSAPSSLAVDLARRFGITLAGFLRDGRFNIYAGRERIVVDARSDADGAARAR